MPQLQELPAYKRLEAHHAVLAPQHLRELFSRDARRFAKMHLQVGPILLDYAKNRATDETLDLLVELVRSCGLEQARAAMFAGEKINVTEGRAVLHTALRAPQSARIEVDGEDVVPKVHAVLTQMRAFVERVRSGAWTGRTGRRITHVVNLGIGGSDLGPVMACEALKHAHHPEMRFHFVSNVDACHLHEALRDCPPEQTLFVVASKTFTTQETMANARSARAWFLAKGGREADVARHFVALSTNEAEVRAFGIDPANMFVFWDWVGGRYSMWSAVGMCIALAIGMDGFEALLRGARAMDDHFVQAPLRQNMPVLLAGLGVWYNHFFAARSHAVLPYAQSLHRFPAYLQQADMESNGKGVGLDGTRLSHPTGAILWGEPGTNGQHAFFQLLHQGTHLVPADFIAVRKPPPHLPDELADHHTLLLANCLAQTEALMRGQSIEEAKAGMQRAQVPADGMHRVLPHKVFSGNRPTNTLVLDALGPYELGALVALYEHKIFVQGVVYGINSFDQWGVELGKQLAQAIVPELRDPAVRHPHDSSTAGLIAHLGTARR